MKCSMVLLLLGVLTVHARDDGLALTPPMGWLAWERFRCNVDCKNDPHNCISENLFMQMADIIAEEGYKEAGYNHVNVDECWTDTTRDSQGRLQPIHDNFPLGMKALGDYIHSKGLKFGMYTDYGVHTCNGKYPGSKDFLQLDSQTFADWGADYVKLDGCYDDPAAWHKYGYPDMAYWLNRTGRPIVLSTEFPFYEYWRPTRPSDPQLIPDYKALSKVCHLARNHGDVADSWDSVVSIIQFYANSTVAGDFASVAGPGFWNDPDMLIIGDFGLSYEQQKAQMAMWCLWASPLLMSVDLRNIDPLSKALLQNTSAIAINQDPLGVQGTVVKQMSSGNLQLWAKRLAHQSDSGCHSYAFVVLSLKTDGMPSTVKLSLKDLGLNDNPAGYRVNEIFDGKDLGKFLANATMSVQVNPTSVFFGKATAL